MARVLLVYVNSYMDNLIPVGVSLLSSCLKKAKHQVKVFDTTFYETTSKTGDQARVDSLQIKSTNLEKYGIKSKSLTQMENDFLNLVEIFKPDIVGFSIVESTDFIFRMLVTYLNKINFKGLKIAGGVYPTTSPETVIDLVDVICIGEGEKSLVELANKISKNQSYDNIPNLWVKKNQKIIKNSLRPLINLDELPFQDWKEYEEKRFYKPMGGKIWISGPIELQRGCPHSCGFCINHKLKKMYGKGYVRQKNIDLFMNEVKEKINKYNISYLYLVAENFLSMKKDDFDEFIKQYKSIGLPFWIETRPETVTEYKLLSLKEVGCEGISIGVEHGNEDFRRKTLNRFVSNEKIINAFKIAKKSNIRVSANNIIGFPTETRELIFDTIKLNRKLKADNVIVNIFCPYRGTLLFDVAVEKGYIDKDYISGDYRGINAGLNMPQLSREEIIGLQRTFPLYVKFKKDKWDSIKKAEQDNKVFNNLKREFK